MLKNNEYVDQSFCAKCENSCCNFLYSAVDKCQAIQTKYAKHNWQTDDWSKESLEKYKISPLYDAQNIHNKTECEFLGPTGCIIDFYLRPQVCKSYVCSKLRKHLNLPDHYTEYIVSNNNGKEEIIPTRNYIDYKELDKLQISRLKICKECINHENEKCKLNNYNLNIRTRIIYPLDENGIAIDKIFPNGTHRHVCQLNKW